MANLLQNFFSGKFLNGLSETFEDIVGVIETISGEEVQTAADEAVEVFEDVVDSAGQIVDQIVDQSEDAFEDFVNLDLADVFSLELPRFSAPADLVQLPSAIFDFIRDLSESDLPNLTLPRLPRLDVSGLGLGRDSIDLNLDLDLNRVLITVQDNVREALDESEDLVNDITTLTSDIIETIDEEGGEALDVLVEAVEGFVEDDPLDIVQGIESVFEIVEDASDGVRALAGEDTVAGFIGGVFDIVRDIAQGTEDIIGTDTGVPEVVDDIGEFTTDLSVQIEAGELTTFEFLEDVVNLSAEVGDFLDDFDELASEAIANFQGLNVGVNLDIDRDLLISVGDVAVEISDIIREIGGGVLLTENPFDFLATNAGEPVILSASVVASRAFIGSGISSLAGTEVLASATLTLDGSFLSAEASVSPV